MEAIELRTGNYITGRIGNYLRCDVDVISRIKYGGIGYDPIPLTEEILLKCNTSKLSRRHISLSPNFFRDASGDYDGFIVMAGNYLISKIKYLHQLQNLYFALTGEELEVNL